MSEEIAIVVSGGYQVGQYEGCTWREVYLFNKAASLADVINNISPFDFRGRNTIEICIPTVLGAKEQTADE